MVANRFPQNVGDLEVDRTEQKCCLFSGLFEEELELNGVTRKFYTYLTPGLLYNQRCLVVAPPDHVDTLDYLEASGWMALADREKIFLHVLTPLEGSWVLDGSDADYMNKVYSQIQARNYYVTMQDNIYAVGIGRGASVAQQAAMKMTSEWSGLATFGDLDGAAMLNAEVCAGAESTGGTELIISATKTQLPVWMLWGENSGANAQVCQYWKVQNDSDGEPFSNSFANEIYFPSTVCKISQINEEKIAQVRVTNGFTGEPDPALIAAVWGYIGKARRHRCFGTKTLRIFEDPVEYGAELHTMEHEGFTRLWYEYVPDCVKESAGPVPLLVVLHGRGGSAESFMDLSGMNRVAEERGFIAVFPESSIYQQRPGGLPNVLSWGGQYQGRQMDSAEFILAVVDDVKARRNIDASRVYLCGQSSGGMMTAQMALRAPNVFAAASPWSSLVNPQRQEPFPEAIQPAIPLMFLFGNHDWLCADPENGELEYRVKKRIADFLRSAMKAYGLNETPLRYTCGEIDYYVYRNAKNVPMLTVGSVKNMSHANYPKESWIAYDEFMCRFSRREDGTLLYMGEEAM